jgi:hypothetical protein
MMATHHPEETREAESGLESRRESRKILASKRFARGGVGGGGSEVAAAIVRGL